MAVDSVGERLFKAIGAESNGSAGSRRLKACFRRWRASDIGKLADAVRIQAEPASRALPAESNNDATVPRSTAALHSGENRAP
jgi:hypothetical protein